jgi:hypothetical protein
MDKRDLSNLGDQILDSVESAIRSMDFKELNKTISDSVNDALAEARNQMQKHGDMGRFSSSRSYRSQSSEWAEPYAKTKKNQESDPGYQAFHTSHSAGKKTGGQAPMPREEGIKINNNGRVAGILFTVFGSIGLLLMTVLLLVMWIIAMVAKPDLWVIVGASLIIASFGAVFGFMLKGGIDMGNRIKRGKLYAKQAGRKMYCTIEELAALVGKSKEFVRKDVQKMMELRIFSKAYLDEQKTCLMLSEDTYKQYLECQKALKERKKIETEEAAIKATNEEKQKFSKEFEDMMAAGRNYLNMLKEANDAIPGEVISQKISDLEDVIRRIFDTVSKHPEQGKEMERFMDYYLPTTVKLVNAYRDFDSAGSRGENVNAAKAEIEKTLDTIQKAFERLLDDLYEDAVLDVTTDASVIQTMLKKDGFAESDFPGGKRNE